MNNFASIIPPDQPIPEPPEMKWVATLIAIACSLAIVSVIAFIAVEFTMDMIGRPLQFGEMPCPDEVVESAPKDYRNVDIDQILSEFRLLSPIHRSRIPGGRVCVLCTWHPGLKEKDRKPPVPLRLYVDEFLVPWDVQFGSNTWIARLDLSSGPHQLRTSVFDADVFVDDSSASSREDALKDWPEFRSHPEIDDITRCDNCHYRIERPDDVVRRGYDRTIGPWKGSASCLTCHPAAEFERTHRHRFAPQEDCRLCHEPHGTTIAEKSLLRDTPKKLCSQCHEPPD